MLSFSAAMTHREFLLWLRPKLESSSRKGLAAEEVAAIRNVLHDMLRAGTLQPFASRLLRLLESAAALDGATVAGLASEVYLELAPPREGTVVAWSRSGDDES
jgi:hypothetical protein